ISIYPSVPKDFIINNLNYDEVFSRLDKSVADSWNLTENVRLLVLDLEEDFNILGYELADIYSLLIANLTQSELYRNDYLSEIKQNFKQLIGNNLSQKHSPKESSLGNIKFLPEEAIFILLDVITLTTDCKEI